MRVFTAVTVDSEDLRQELVNVRDELNLGFKPVKRDKLHVTLQFFDDINKADTETIKKSLEQVEVGSFTSTVRGVSSFPSQDYIRVVWAGIDNEKFKKLHEQSSNHKVTGKNPENFIPHITLLRVDRVDKRRKAKLKKTIDQFGNYFFGKLEAKSVKIIKSNLKQDQTEYKVLKKVEL